MNDWHVAGVAIGIVSGDSIILLKGYGYRDYNKKLAFTPQTIFPIASNSKPFTATLTLMTEHEKKIVLDSPIHKYLPGLQFYKDELTNNVTVKDIICHRSGLPGHDWAWTFNTNYSGKEYFSRIRHFEFSAPLRTKFQYSNFNYIILSELAETIAGSSWSTLVKEKIFTRLEMNNSYPAHSLVPPNSQISYSYNFEDSFLLRHSGAADDLKGAVAINSTAEDLCHWLQFWLKRGNYKGQQLLPPENIIRAISSHFVVSDGLPDDPYKDIFFQNMGLGWFLSAYRGHYKVSHGGNLDGFRSELCFYPDDNLGIVILANQNGSALGSLIPLFVSDLMLTLPARDLHSVMLELSKKRKNIRDSSQVQLDTIRYPFQSWEKITGNFFNKGYGNLQLKKSGSLLVFSHETTEFVLIPKIGDVFRAYYMEGKIGSDSNIGDIILIPDERGMIKSVSIPFESGVSNIIFERIHR